MIEDSKRRETHKEQLMPSIPIRICHEEEKNDEKRNVSVADEDIEFSFLKRKKEIFSAAAERPTEF